MPDCKIAAPIRVARSELFFFQAEDGILDGHVTGVQTCALPILIDAVERVEVQRFVMLSTDKAVRCSSVMGATKRIGELCIQKQGWKSKTHYSCVRFGNVLGKIGRASCRERV